MKCLLMPQAWSPMHASMPVIFLSRHLPKHRQVHDDQGNSHVLSLHRLHRHLSALEDVKRTVVEVRTQRLNVSLVWIADSSPPGASSDVHMLGNRTLQTKLLCCTATTATTATSSIQRKRSTPMTQHTKLKAFSSQRLRSTT